MSYFLDLDAMQQLVKEKNINRDYLIDSIVMALTKAFQKEGDRESAENIEVIINRETGETSISAAKRVVEEVTDEGTEISLADAQKLSRRYEVGDTVNVDVTPSSFGRIAAQTAKNVIIQRMREAERDYVFDEYSEKQNEMVTGQIQETDGERVMVKIGEVNAVLPESEQINGEEYKFNALMKLYVLDVKKSGKAAYVTLSRSHPGLVKRLFEQEVPEIHDGIVEIKGLAREPGSRSKIAVHSVDENVDAVGACIGQHGSRVQVISDELRGEKIDVIKWYEDPAQYVSESLSPAKVIDVRIHQEEKTASVVVPDNQLSLAIGKEGQNARLAARLTGWKIDIKSESQVKNA